MKYKYEMHQHTAVCSHCGRADPEELVRTMKSEGFAGCVITDHFYHGNSGIDRNLPWREFCKPYEENFLKAKAVGDKLDFDVLFGIEEHVGNGKEVLLYGITPEFIYENPILREMNLKTIYELAHDAGAVVIQAHPFRDRDYIPDPKERLNPDLLDGYEIFNASNKPEDNTEAIEYFKNTDKIFIAGSDAHREHMDGRAWIEFDRRIRTEKELAEALKNREHTLSVKI